MFGFESGIDIANETQVLYRKNVVIKNIILVSNLIFTLIFALLSIGESSNIILMVILFPVTWLFNHCLKKTINKNPSDYMTQMIASYVNCFYMLLIAIVIYVKLRFGSIVFLQECGYILLYYSLAICSFYQNKKLLKMVFEWTLVIVTILHFTTTYTVVVWANDANPLEFLKSFMTSAALKDIIVRTILLLAFMLVLYCIVSMSGYMQEERKKELMKRREVQEDFTNVVTSIFEVTLNSNVNDPGEADDAIIISKMAQRLSVDMGLSEQECKEIEEYAKIHVEKHVNFDPTGASEDEKFELLKEQTELGRIIIARLQLERKCEKILRRTFEDATPDHFIEEMKKIQNDTRGQIVMICELYVLMRTPKSFKKAYGHKTSIDYIENHLRVFLDPIILERFQRFNDEFEKIYDENGGLDDDL